MPTVYFVFSEQEAKASTDDVRMMIAAKTAIILFTVFFIFVAFLFLKKFIFSALQHIFTKKVPAFNERRDEITRDTTRLLHKLTLTDS